MMVGGINPQIFDATEEIQSFCDQVSTHKIMIIFIIDQHDYF